MNYQMSSIQSCFIRRESLALNCCATDSVLRCILIRQMKRSKSWRSRTGHNIRILLYCKERKICLYQPASVSRSEANRIVPSVNTATAPLSISQSRSRLDELNGSFHCSIILYFHTLRQSYSYIVVRSDFPYLCAFLSPSAFLRNTPFHAFI